MVVAGVASVSSPREFAIDMHDFQDRSGDPVDQTVRSNADQARLASDRGEGEGLAEVNFVRIDARGNVVRSKTQHYVSPPAKGASESPMAGQPASARQAAVEGVENERVKNNRGIIHPPAIDFSDVELSDVEESRLVPPMPRRRGGGEDVAASKSRTAAIQTAADRPDGAGPAKRQKSRSADSMTGPLVLLATMTMTLLAARFVVPHIVEEIRYSWRRGELMAEYEVAGDGLKNVSLSALSQAYQMVTSAVGPSVVHLDVSRDRPTGGEDFAGRFGNRGFGNEFLTRPDSTRPESNRPDSAGADQGSGVVVDQSGYILTNEHVVNGGGRIVVTLSDGRRRDAVVVGTDTLTDLAVLKIDADGLMPIAWGDSDDCRVGSPVWAVGSPFGLDRTVTFGILSGKHRMVRANTAYQDFMQSDVAVNPGNSGGPLVDADGKLVGINTAILGDFYQGVSFSIPSKVARRIYDSIREKGVVERAWLGVMLASVPDEMLIGENSRRRGALVGGLAPDRSPAGDAGVSPGDIILKFGDVLVDDTAHLMRLVGSEVAGNVVTVGVNRRGEPMQIDVLLGAKP